MWLQGSAKKESYDQANVNKISRGKLQKYFYIVLIINERARAKSFCI